MPFTWRDLEPWIAPAAIVVGAVALGVMVRVLAIPRLSRLTGRTKTELDDLFLRSIQNHVPLWFLLGGIGVALHVAPVEAKWVEFAHHGAAALFFVSLS